MESDVSFGVKFLGKTKKESYKSFTAKELKKIFSYINSNKEQLKSHHYWVPLISLYTGARLNEICQLYCNDVKKVDEIWCFDFQDDTEDKSIKNESSKRLIPIPEVLLELGIIKFINNVQGERLFSELKHYKKGGYGRDLSKWFSKLLKELDICDKGKTFHSFRHGFSDAQYQLGTNEVLVNAIMGHTNKSESYTTYKSKMLNMKVLKEIIDSISFEI